MPGKSRHKKVKYSIQSKRKKDRLSHPTVVVQQQAIAQAHEPAPLANMSASSTGKPTTMAKPAAMQYPYIATELWTIGILAVIMLIILTVLALVLS
ncbi:hypothetical protein ACFLTO_04400 [Chloroflexota bacterium]